MHITLWSAQRISIFNYLESVAADGATSLEI